MENKYITVSYRLYAMNGGEKELIEEAPAAHPFQFISGIGYTLDRFEKEITALEKGTDFSFTIPCAEAYGERDEDNVRQVSKAMFCDPDGNFDSENIYPGNIIMLNDNEGHRFYANVGEITDDKVVIDLNHPHAGKDLMFEGKIIEMRPATNKEIEEIVNAMSGGCGGHCEGCGGGCGEEGHHHHDEDGCCGGGCGHCH
jgi:FKBP-type peptidyl-prolyl cis-trans isomerase SlyD